MMPCVHCKVWALGRIILQKDVDSGVPGALNRKVSQAPEGTLAVGARWRSIQNRLKPCKLWLHPCSTCCAGSCWHGFFKTLLGMLQEEPLQILRAQPTLQAPRSNSIGAGLRRLWASAPRLAAEVSLQHLSLAESSEPSTPHPQRQAMVTWK